MSAVDSRKGSPLAKVPQESSWTRQPEAGVARREELGRMTDAERRAVEALQEPEGLAAA
jgi:hypothetical protein